MAQIVAQIVAGLDFGTSNSAIGYAGPQGLGLHRFADGGQVIPSALFFDEDDQKLTFGADAQARFMVGDDGRYIRALKSILGTGLIEESTRLGGRPWPFRALLRNFLAYMKRDLEQAVGAKVTRLVAGRPVRFIDEDDRRDAAAEAFLAGVLEEIGFEEVRFLYEPLAALVDAADVMDDPRLVLVADIGGGTSDFSIARGGGQNAEDLAGFEILANHGVHVGGTDLDKQLSLDTAMPLFGYRSEMRDFVGETVLPVPVKYFTDLATWQKIHLIYTQTARRELEQIRKTALEPDRIARLITLMDRRLGHQLATAVERVKIELSDAEATSLMFDAIADLPTRTITRAHLTTATATHVQQIRDAIARTFALAGVAPDEIDHVVLTGGSTLLTDVRRAISDCAPAARIVAPDEFGGVAKGLTKAARMLFA